MVGEVASSGSVLSLSVTLLSWVLFSSSVVVSLSVVVFSEPSVEALFSESLLSPEVLF